MPISAACYSHYLSIASLMSLYIVVQMVGGFCSGSAKNTANVYDSKTDVVPFSEPTFGDARC